MRNAHVERMKCEANMMGCASLVSGAVCRHAGIRLRMVGWGCHRIESMPCKTNMMSCARPVTGAVRRRTGVYLRFADRDRRGKAGRTGDVGACSRRCSFGSCDRHRAGAICRDVRTTHCEGGVHGCRACNCGIGAGGRRS